MADEGQASGEELHEPAEQAYESPLGFSSPQEELDAVKTRMAEIKEIVTSELIRDWPSPWKNESMVNAKVTGRLSSNRHFQVLLARCRELEAELGIRDPSRESETAQDPMGSYASKIAADRNAQEPPGG